MRWEASGWCDLVRVSVRSHRVASLSLLAVTPGLALEPRSWPHHRLLALLPTTLVLGPGEQRIFDLASVCVNAQGAQLAAYAFCMGPCCNSATSCKMLMHG